MNLQSRLEKLEEQFGSKSNDWKDYRGLSFHEFWAKVGDEKLEFFDYEQELFEKLQNHKYVWIKKATGLGITEWMLRYMAWLCCYDDALKNRHLCIVTGPRIDLAEDLIERIKKLFPFEIDGKKTVAIINGKTIEAFPSNHLDAARGIPDVAFFLLDEADFFRIGEQQNARDVSERYIAKSDPQIVMVSTPNLPGGLFEKMELEEPSIYHKIRLDYTKGVGKIYSQEDIEKAKQSPSFEREYNLKYGYGIGNIWLPEHLEKCKIKTIPKSVYGAPKSIGIDEAFGKSTKLAITISQLVDGKVQFLKAEERENQDPNELAKEIVGWVMDYTINFSRGDKIFVDASNPAFIKTLKRYFQERIDYQEHIDDTRRNKLDYERIMKIVPIPFGGDTDREMLSHARELGNDEVLAIPEEFTTLLTHMYAAKTENDGTLDKKADSNDIIDSLFLNLRRYHY